MPVMHERRDDFEIQGHRGARGLFPENTIEGFRRTIAMGVRVVELDVAVTCDGVPVVFHDVSLNPDIVRSARGEWIAPPERPINAMTHAELAAFDVGRLRSDSEYARKFSGQTAIDGARIPALAEVFALAVATGVRVNAELKTHPGQPDATVAPEVMARLVIEAAEACDALGLLDVRSFDWRAIRASRTLKPSVPVTVLTSAETAAHRALWWAGEFKGSVPASVALSFPGATWAPEYATVSREEIAEAHGHGLRVVPWTVNNAADIARMIEWRVDGICTDYPNIALAYQGFARPG